jgi:probable HAF family extracellular repeat protein
MRTRTLRLLLPSLILLTGCGETTATAPQTSPQDPLLAEVSGGTVSYSAMVLDGGNGNVMAINDAGIAVGMARQRGEERYPALRWVVTTDGVTGPEKLPFLPAPFDNAFSHQPLAVNSSGSVVGYFQDNNRYGAFVYHDNMGMQPLPWFVGNTYGFWASDINDEGIVVGWIDFAVRDADGKIVERRKRAAVWSNTADEPKLLPPLEGHDVTSAGSINTAGLVLGTSGVGGDPSVGVAWVVGPDGGLLEGPHELTAGFRSHALNKGSDMIGSFEWCRAAFVRGSHIEVLPLLTPDDTCTWASDLTDVAVDGTVMIVGHTGNGTRAALWTLNPDGQAIEAMDLGIPKSTQGAYARGVNTRGWIVGAARTKNSGDVPALWLPHSGGGDDGGGDCNPHPRTGKCRN